MFAGSCDVDCVIAAMHAIAFIDLVPCGCTRAEWTNLPHHVRDEAIGHAGLLVATLSTNIAANIVAPANALVNLAPGRISFKTGALLTSLAGILIMPWRLIASTQVNRNQIN